MSPLQQLASTPLASLTRLEERFEGTLKTTPEDFIVEEIPIYLPSGEGDHLYLWIEKRDVSAEQLQQHLSRTLGVHRNDIGVAGLKDRRAVTRQWVSVPLEFADRLDAVNSNQINVLESARHTNKLKTGHLKGNRFRLIVQTDQPDALMKADGVRHKLLATGVPNYFGAQRFGIDGETLAIGQRLLSGEMTVEEIPKSRRKFLSRLSLSAVQSALFNVILSDRMEKETFNKVGLGDVLQVVATGGPFVSTEPAIDQVRFEQREVVTTGPLFGPKMKSAAGEQQKYEESFLTKAGLNLTDFSRYKKLTSGARRPLLLYLNELTITPVDRGLQFQFDLPSGAYATIVLREFLSEDNA